MHRFNISLLPYDRKPNIASAHMSYVFFYVLHKKDSYKDSWVRKSVTGSTQNVVITPRDAVPPREEAEAP
jgi:hypothetical protein